MNCLKQSIESIGHFLWLIKFFIIYKEAWRQRLSAFIMSDFMTTFCQNYFLYGLNPFVGINNVRNWIQFDIAQFYTMRGIRVHTPCFCQ